MKKHSAALSVFPLPLRLTARTIICAVMFSLCACAPAGNSTGGGNMPYYAVTENGRDALERREIFCPENENPIEFVVGHTLTELGGALGCAAGSLLSAETADGIATLRLTAAYGELKGYERTMADACLVLGVTAAEDIEGVVLSVEGENETAPPVALYADDFLWSGLDVTESSGGSVRFFSDAAGRYAVPELLSIVPGEGGSMERYLLLDLIAGPKKEGLRPVIPAGTELRGVTMSGRVCTADFSRAFVDNADGGFAAARMTLCCIVATLCALPEVDAVRLMVEGEPRETYFGLDCREALTPDPFIQTGGERSSAFDINLFYPDMGGAQLRAVPVTLAVKDGQLLAQTAVELLCHGAAPLGMRSALPADARVQSVRAEDYGYSVDFSAGFSRTEPPFGPEMALQSIAHLLAELRPGAAVRFTQDGAPLTSYQGYEPPARLRADTALLG